MDKSYFVFGRFGQRDFNFRLYQQGFICFSLILLIFLLLAYIIFSLEHLLSLLYQLFIPFFNTFLFLKAHLDDLLRHLFLILYLLQQFLFLFVLLPFVFFNHQLLVQVLLIFQLFIKPLSFFSRSFTLHLLFIFHLLLHLFDRLELFVYKFLLFLKLQIRLIDLYVVHYLCVFHAQNFTALIQHFLSISIIFGVYLQKIIMISIKPFTFAFIYSTYLFIQIFNLSFQFLNFILIMIRWVQFLFLILLFIFLNLFYFILEFQGIVK